MGGEESTLVMKLLKYIIRHLRHLLRNLIFFNIKTSTASCYEFGHTWTPYCRTASWDVFVSAFKASLKIYSSVYLATALLKRRSLDYYVNVVWKDILRSTAFLTANAFGFMGAFCAWSHSIDGFNITSAYCAGVLSSLFALGGIEQKSRHGMLAMYTANLALETLYNMLRARGLLPSVPYGDILIFSSALAGYLHLHRKAGAIDSFSSGIISTVFGTDEAASSDSTSTVDSSPLAKAYTFLPQFLKQALAQIVTRRCFRVRHSSCGHQWGCLLNVTEKFVRCFLMGYGISAGLKIPGAVSQLTRGNNPLGVWLLSRDNLSCGAFMASMSSLHQGVSCLLRWWRGKADPSVDGMVSGAVAGLAMYLYRSPAIALYVFTRLIDLWCGRLVKEGKLPNVKNAYIYVYAFGTAVLFHAGVWEPHNIRPAYWKFMLNITGGKFAYLNRVLLERTFGMESATLYPGFWPKYDPRFTNMLTPDALISCHQ